MELPNASLAIELADKEKYDMYKKWLADPSCSTTDWAQAWIGLQELLAKYPEWDPILAKALNNPNRKQC